MLGDTSRELLEFVASLGSGVPAFLVSPASGSASKGEYISIYLLEITLPSNPVTRALKGLSISMRYLVTTFAEGEEEAHDLLEEILKAVWLNKDYQLEMAPPPENLWLALGIPPRPCVIIEADREISFAEDEVQVVTKDLILEQNLKV